jgi:hypothetical protein
MNWPMLWFPPINLFSLPRQEEKCRHTHWITYVSWKKKECVDCHIQKPLYDLTIEHQR